MSISGLTNWRFNLRRPIFGIASGKTTGRGLGLGFPEVIPIADSDYVYAAIAEETGLVGGAVVIFGGDCFCDCRCSHFARRT